MDWKTSAALFPGQGSQTVGMGADFAGEYEIARQTFEQADDILGFDLSRFCFEGPSDAVGQDGHITQPALYACSVAIWRVLACIWFQRRRAREGWPGHSLGEFSALTAAGALDFR